MTDNNNADPFADVLHGAVAQKAAAPSDDPFGDMLSSGGKKDETSAFGAGLHEAERGVIPALAGSAAAASGAALGAELGLLGGPFAPITVPVGGFIGGLGGFMLGAKAGGHAQEYALSQLPDSFKESIGQDERTRRMEAEQHPTASFIGGLVPYALTMSPGAFTTKSAAVADNATAFQRILANPLTSRAFGGAVMGGLNVWDDYSAGKPTDWTNAAIATGFGMVFNKPTKLGETLHGLGERAYEPMAGRAAQVAINLRGSSIPEEFRSTPFASPFAAPLPQDHPVTIAQAGDAKVIGEGVTESVFRGGTQQAPQAEAAAQAKARAELETIGPLPPKLDEVAATARKMHPELFAEYDALKNQRDEFAKALTTPESPPPPAVRAALKDHFDTVSRQMTEVDSEIAAAHRRAADALVSETVPPSNEPTETPAVTAPQPPPQTAPSERTLLGNAVSPRSIEEQKQFIADDMARRLIAAGMPQDQAEAHGAWVSAYYPTRAAKFKGALGPADELYAKEDSAVRGPDGKMHIPAMPPKGSRISDRPATTTNAGPLTVPAPQLGSAATAPEPLFIGGQKVTGELAERLRQRMAPKPPFLAHEQGPVATESSQNDIAPKLPQIGDALAVKAQQRVDAAKALSVEESGYGSSAIGRMVKEMALGNASVAAHIVAMPELVKPEIRRLADGQIVDTPKGRVRVPDVDHAALFDVGRRLAEGDRMRAPADAKTLRDILDRFKGFAVEDDGVPFSTPNHVRDLAKDYYEGAIEMAHPEGVANAGDMLAGDAERYEWLKRLVDEAQIGMAPAQAAQQAFAKATHDGGKSLSAYSEAAIQPHGEGEPAGVFMFDPTKLNVDASRFQFKPGGDEYGVTGALRSVSKWDAAKAQAIIVWEQHDGKLFVADGHQRSGLARRLTEQGLAKNVKLPGILYREVDGITADDMRAIAAMTNIANGSGSALDGAKVLRARPELLDGSLPLSAGKGKQAAGLAKLGDEPFRMAVNDIVPEHQAAIVGELIPNDHARQLAAMKAISRFEPKNVEETSVLVQRVAQAELAKAEDGKQMSMFGDLETAESTAGEEMKIVGRAIKDLKKDKGLFARIVANAERIEQTGSHIERESAQSIATDADIFAKTLASDAYSAGSVRNELTAAAKDMKDGKASISDASTRILAAIRRQVEENGADRAGARQGAGDGASSEARTVEFAQNEGIKQRELAAQAEPGAEGLPQTLIPGVSPVTDRDRLVLESSKPMRGGNADMPYDGLFGDGQNQRDLFFQGARGKIRFAEGQRPIISLMKDFNASTFPHEKLGHEFLEQMMRDSEHPAAPDGLLDDAQTVRDYLGANAGDPITARQHEKFARAAEQYLREGIAPSKELAGVFAKFKSWMLQIYQTLKGLGAPISPDIRGVFDRMLAHDHDTVIATPHDGGPSLHDIHEADAAEVDAPHAAAAAAADRIVAEKEQFKTEPPEDIAHEIAPTVAKVETERAEAAARAEPTGQAGDAAGGDGQVESSGGDAGAQSESGGVGAGRGAKLEGGGDAVPEGAGADAAAGDGRGNDPANGHPLAERPAKIFGPDESPFLDKAGNIRIENLTDAKEVADAIMDSAERNDDFNGVRGRMTKGQMMDLADDMGLDPSKISEQALGQLLGGLDNLAPKVLAVRKLLVESATNVSRLAKQVAELGTDEARLAFTLAISRHDMIQSALSGATASWGRTGSAFHNLMGGWDQTKGLNQILKENTGRDLFQIDRIAKLASTLETPQQMSKFVADSRKPGFRRMILEYWINGLISGPATHTTYMVGNALLGVMKAGPETAVAAMLGARHSEGPRVRMGEVGAQFAGAARGFAPALAASVDAMRTGVTTLLPGENARNMASSGAGGMPLQPGAEYAPSARLNPDATMADVGAQLYASARGLRDGLVAGAALVKSGGVAGAPMFGLRESPLGAIPDIDVKGVNALPVGSIVRAPGRAIAAIHSFFRSMNYAMDINAQAYRMAAEAGKTGDEFASAIADGRQNPSEQMMDAARENATDLTLMGQGSEFVKALAKLTNTEIFGFPYLKFIDPFVHIAGNVLDQSLVQRSPAGLLSKEVRADLLGKNGNVAQDVAMAKMLCGTALGALFGGLASQGLASGSGPSDPHKAAVWRQAGNQAHSIRIGDIWYDTHRLGPLGMLTGVAADLYDVAHKAQTEDTSTIASMIAHSFAQNILDESFMRGPAEFLRAVEDSDRYGAAYARQMVASFVPFSVGMSQIARAGDPYSRQARTFMDAIKQKVPGLSEELMPRRDIWGEPMVNHDALVAKGVTAIYESQMSRDPVNLAMVQLGIGLGPVERKIRNIELTEQQYDQFATLAGRTTKKRLDAIVGSPDWQRWSTEVRHNLIVETVRQSREMARNFIMAHDRTIPTRAYQLKMQKLQGKPIE